MVAILLPFFLLLVLSVAVGLALETLAKFIPRLGLRIAVVAVIRGCFYSGTMVADTYIAAFLPTVLVLPRWVSLVAEGRFDVIMAVPALAVAAVSLLTSAAGFGIYRRSEAGRGQRDRQSDRAHYAAALRRLGPVGGGEPRHPDHDSSQGKADDEK